MWFLQSFISWSWSGSSYMGVFYFISYTLRSRPFHGILLSDLNASKTSAQFWHARASLFAFWPKPVLTKRKRIERFYTYFWLCFCFDLKLLWIVRHVLLLYTNENKVLYCASWLFFQRNPKKTLRNLPFVSSRAPPRWLFRPGST